MTRNSEKERYTQWARKSSGKTRVCTIGAKIDTTASSPRLKLLLPAILINSLSQFIEKGLKTIDLFKKLTILNRNELLKHPVVAQS